jgi:hypothetical protein
MLARDKREERDSPDKQHGVRGSSLRGRGNFEP